MSGPNGDPNISIDDGIINDEDDFEVEGKEQMRSFIVNSANRSYSLNSVYQPIDNFVI